MDDIIHSDDLKLTVNPVSNMIKKAAGCVGRLSSSLKNGYRCADITDYMETDVDEITEILNKRGYIVESKLITSRFGVQWTAYRIRCG